VTAEQRGILMTDIGMRYASRNGDIDALSGVTLHIPAGQFVCIVGPSGCGKTTLLRILAGLESATSGTLSFGFDTAERPLRSMVFQEQGIFPWMTVLENAAYGLRARHVPAASARETAHAYLAKLGLRQFANYYPRELSGGMRQRVNLARAFANDACVLLMDEPLSALDQQTKLLVQRDLLRLWEETRKTVVFITHSLDEAVVLSDRVVIMTHRPGTIKKIVDVDLPRPRDVLELGNDEAFLAYRRRCWDELRDEVLAVAALEESGV
jgi:NitT/TauT family transport system ATP-binding protein